MKKKKWLTKKNVWFAVDFLIILICGYILGMLDSSTEIIIMSKIHFQIILAMIAFVAILRNITKD